MIINKTNDLKLMKKSKHFKSGVSLLLAPSALFLSSEAHAFKLDTELHSFKDARSQDKQEDTPSLDNGVPLKIASSINDKNTVEVNDRQWYDLAIQQHQSGNAELASDMVAKVHEKYPDSKKVLNDYILVLVAANKNEKALALINELEPDNSPAYVLEAMAQAERKSGNPNNAQTLYGLVVSKWPDRVDSALGLALSLLEAKQGKGAVTAIKEASIRFPNNIEVWDTYGFIHKELGIWPQSLNGYAHVLTLDPKNINGLRGKVFALARLGAPKMAAEIAFQYPGLLSPDEELKFLTDKSALNIRWGATDDDSAPDKVRFKHTDMALAENDEAMKRIQMRGLTGTPAETAILYDRVVALTNRKRWQEAIYLYESLKKSHGDADVNLPAYVRQSAASSYQYLKNPARSKQMFMQLIKEDPKNFWHQFGLFYALVELNEHRAAQVVIDTLAKNTPMFNSRKGDKNKIENPEYSQALIAQAMESAYRDRLTEGRKLLNNFLDRAPHNESAHVMLGSVYEWSGMPRHALEEVELVLAENKKNKDALSTKAAAHMAMGEWREAETEIRALAEQYPDDQRIKKLKRSWEVHNMRQLETTARFSKESGGDAGGGVSFEMDTKLYTAPLDYNWRLFAHNRTAEATIDKNGYARHRNGVGVEFVNTDVSATAEMSFSDADNSFVGVEGGVAWKLNDNWTLRAAGSSSTNDIPLKASYYGIEAKDVRLGATWRQDETRSVSLDTHYTKFSDGNARKEIGLGLYQQIMADHNYKIYLNADVSKMTDSKADAAYFNPKSATSASGTLAGEYVQYKEEDGSSLTHKVYGTAGAFNQEGYGSKPLMAVGYEAKWTFGDTMELKLGAERSRRPYDGVESNATTFLINFGWRF